MGATEGGPGRLHDLVTSRLRRRRARRLAAGLLVLRRRRDRAAQVPEQHDLGRVGLGGQTWGQ